MNFRRTVFGCVLLGYTFQSYATLTLDDFLNQVQSKHQGILASKNIAVGVGLQSQEASLILSPNFFITIQNYDDKKVNASPTTQGTRTIVDTYSAGLSKVTSFGTVAKLTYNWNSYDIRGTSRTLVLEPKYYEVKPTLEFSQSLWRNGFGRETKNTIKLMTAGLEAQQFGEQFKIKMMLAEAEGAYWRLALARATVNVQKETLARAEKIKAWNQRRANLLLADKSDLLQAEAVVEARSLELQAALDEEAQARRTFNQARSIDSDEVDEEIQLPDLSQIKDIRFSSEAPVREDLKAVDKQREVAMAQAMIGKEKNSPTLDVFGSYSYNGRDINKSKAQEKGLDDKNPTAVIGVKFSVPLEIGTLTRVSEGHTSSSQGAELNYQRKVFEQKREWQDLLTKFEEAKKRVALAEKIELAQKNKLDYEKDRQTRGRSTTFQVLMFEQDYASAQLNLLRAQAEVLKIVANMKTFGGVL